MKNLLKSVMSLTLLLSSAVLGQGICPTSCLNDNACITSLNSNSNVHTYINYRSQGANTARELVGWEAEIYRPNMCECYGVTTFAFEYQRTFRDERIARDWFGTECLRFQGSGIEVRANDALVADYFGLGSEFSGAICFSPQIENLIFDWNFFVGLDNWYQGLYFRAHLPLVNSKWSLFKNGDGCFNSICPTPTPTSTVAPLPACFVGEDVTSSAVNNIPQALACGNGNALFGSNQAGCISCCEMSETRLADIDLILGWLPFNTECYHLGLYLQYVAPTGTKYDRDDSCSFNGAYFRPQIGNGHHNEFGVGITGHTMIWDDQQYQSLAFYVEGNVTHMFGDCQHRLFDLCGAGAYSRYMLLREFDAEGTPTGLVRANNTSVVNRLVDVKIDAKVDFSFKFEYRYCNWELDLGYNIYYHSQEEIACNNNYDNCPISTNGNRYGIAGLTGSCCFSYDVITPGEPGCVIDSSSVATSPISATVTGANMFNPALGMIPEADATITGATESICLAFNSTQPEELDPTVPDPACLSITAANGFRPVQGDIGTPTFLSNGLEILNLNSGLSPAYLSHKIFAHVNYLWEDECGWNPFLGIGAEVEFDGNSRNDDCFNGCVTPTTANDFNCNQFSCRDSNRVGLNQWGVWIKGGFSF